MDNWYVDLWITDYEIRGPRDFWAPVASERGIPAYGGSPVPMLFAVEVSLPESLHESFDRFGASMRDISDDRA